MKQLPQKIQRLMPSVLILILILPYIAIVRTDFKSEVDSAIYLGLAKSIALSGEYSFNSSFHTKYPPGFPLMMAPIYKIFGESYLAMYLFQTLIMAISFYLVIRVIGMHWDMLKAIIIAILLAFSVHSILINSYLWSEPLFLSLSLSSVLLADFYFKSKQKVPLLLILTLILSATALTRTIGITLIIAVSGFFLLNVLFKRDALNDADNKRKSLGKIALLIVISFTPIFIWFGLVHFKGQTSESYFRFFFLKHPVDDPCCAVKLDAELASFPDIVRTAVRRGAESINSIAYICLNRENSMNLLWRIPVLMVFFIGLIVETSRKLFRSCLFLYGICYFGVLIFWPYSAVTRFHYLIQLLTKK